MKLLLSLNSLLKKINFCFKNIVMVYEGYDFEDYRILFNFYILLTILHLKMVTYFYSI
jgi:hypothetical protein